MFRSQCSSIIVATMLCAVLGIFFGTGCGDSTSGGGGSRAITLTGSLGSGYTVKSAGGSLTKAAGEVDKIIAIPVEHGLLSAYCMQQSRSALINPDGTFSISIDAQRDWILILADTTAATAIDQFIGYIDLSAGAANSLLLFPGTDATASTIDLGPVDASDDTAVATNPVTEADLNITAAQLAELAKNDDMFKIVKNMVINYDPDTGVTYTLRPDFGWQGSYAAVENAFPDLTSTPDFYTYQSYSFQLDSNSTELTMDEICANGVPRVPVELFPPAATSVTSTAPAVYTDVNPISNADTVLYDMAGGVHEGRGTDFYCTDGFDNISYSVGMGLYGPIPAGYWQYKVGGNLRAQFDVAVAKPLDASNRALGFTPVARVNVEAGTSRILSVDLKWYYLDGGVYTELTDISVLNHLIGTGGIFLDRRLTGTEYESINMDPAVTTNLVPTGTWYFNDTDSIGIFYESSGLGFFFGYFAP